jgi:hypothetical protein
MSQATKKRLLFGRMNSLFKKCKHKDRHSKKTKPRYRNDNRVLSFLVVIPQGLEPRTASLEGRCSIQLSYETISHLKSTARLRGCKYASRFTKIIENMKHKKALKVRALKSIVSRQKS